MMSFGPEPVDIDDDREPPSLAGQLLIAMPTMGDQRFERTVIYLCAHSPRGAMGLVINRLAESVSFPELLTQLGIEPRRKVDHIRVHSGGPVADGRGFVLHSSDYLLEDSLKVSEQVALTGTLDVLRAIADGTGPRQALFALGYAGWGPGQLDSEIQENGWLHAPSDPRFLFDPELPTKWQRAIGRLGFEVGRLSGEAGHA